MTCADLYAWMSARSRVADSTDAVAWRALKVDVDRVCVAEVRDKARSADGWHTLIVGTAPCADDQTTIVNFNQPRVYTDCSADAPPPLGFWRTVHEAMPELALLVAVGVLLAFLQRNRRT